MNSLELYEILKTVCLMRNVIFRNDKKLPDFMNTFNPL